MECALVAAVFVLVSWAFAWPLYSYARKAARDAEERLARAHEQIDELTEELERVRDITFKQWKAGRQREEP
jgi:hypothetical protein